jgi:hypothetical protein
VPLEECLPAAVLDSATALLDALVHRVASHVRCVSTAGRGDPLTHAALRCVRAPVCAVMPYGDEKVANRDTKVGTARQKLVL